MIFCSNWTWIIKRLDDDLTGQRRESDQWQWQWEISFQAVKDNDSLPNYKPLERQHMAPPIDKASPFQFNWVALPIAFSPTQPSRWFASTDFFSFYYNNHQQLVGQFHFHIPLILSHLRQINISIYVSLSTARLFCLFLTHTTFFSFFFFFFFFFPDKNRPWYYKFNSASQLTSTVCPSSG